MKIKKFNYDCVYMSVLINFVYLLLNGKFNLFSSQSSSLIVQGICFYRSPIVGLTMLLIVNNCWYTKYNKRRKYGVY